MRNTIIAAFFIIMGLGLTLNSIISRNPQFKYSTWRLIGGVIGGLALIGWGVYLLVA